MNYESKARPRAGTHQDIKSALRALPSINALLECDQASELLSYHGHGVVVTTLREVLDDCRDRLWEARTAPSADAAAILGEACSRLVAMRAPTLQGVINATGVIVHTNLGRAPLAKSAIEAIADVAEGYSNLEYNLDSGERGSRYFHIRSLLRELTGAEDALVVNNNAAAVMLAVSALAHDREVIISRGELVEIGGSFRIPDVIRQSGAKLVEVGTTNKTHTADYETAVTDQTGLFLKVHQSNFRIIGFTKETSVAQLAAIGRESGIPLMEDMGSGLLTRLSDGAHQAEPTVSERLAAGVDIVTFSGDKMLGGPQAGIIVGRKDLLQPIYSHPLLRALRIDKLSLAALDATLRLYRNPERLARELPVARMMLDTVETLTARAARLNKTLNNHSGIDATVETGSAVVGGGSMPEQPLPSVIVKTRIGKLGAGEIAARLRNRTPPVIGRIVDGCFAADTRTLTDAEAETVARALLEIAL